MRPDALIELGIVVAGARGDQGQYDAGLAILSDFAHARKLPTQYAVRIAEARAGLLRLAGRTDEAEQIEAKFELDRLAAEDDEEIIVFEVPADDDEIDAGAAEPDPVSIEDEAPADQSAGTADEGGACEDPAREDDETE
ncbi:hypothetical protein FB389_0170 [Rarobacter incanus]|uniref:Tetratricopeptide repeat protein n=1 Tax=Rarobacter incanus TaxID=153494 RepID=A0A542SLN4_9MICO|nr:hypothetical protein FB389_0170 [Rarobacter incanus]